jgi:hypothetical protein
MRSSRGKIPEQPEIPEDVSERAKNLISHAFSLIGQQIERLGKDLEDFNSKRAEIRRKINDGARRTSGRIV